MTEETMQVFVAAIVERAVRDWRKAVSQLTDNPEYPYALATQQEIEEFFTGERFAFLCDINPDLTNQNLQE